jgi:hypothetical protein
MEKELHDETCGLSREHAGENRNEPGDEGRAVQFFVSRPGPGRPDFDKIPARHGILGPLQPIRTCA